MKVLVDEITEEGAIARSTADAPEIDGRVIIAKPGDLNSGDWAQVKITRAGKHDLWARMI